MRLLTYFGVMSPNKRIVILFSIWYNSIRNEEEKNFPKQRRIYQ